MRNFQKKKKKKKNEKSEEKNDFYSGERRKEKRNKNKGGGSVICCAVTWPLWKEKKRPREISKTPFKGIVQNQTHRHTQVLHV